MPTRVEHTPYPIDLLDSSQASIPSLYLTIWRVHNLLHTLTFALFFTVAYNILKIVLNTYLILEIQKTQASHF